MVRVGGVILAAGSSSRFGAPKQLLEFYGEMLVQRIVRVAQEGGCSPVVVVTGASDKPVAAAVAGLHPLVIRNENWVRGIGTSIRVGVEQLTDHDISAIVLLACDQPAVDSDVVTILLQLRAVSLSGTIFSDAAFTSLKDFGSQIVPEPVGRANPFAPLTAVASTSRSAPPPAK